MALTLSALSHPQCTAFVGAWASFKIWLYFLLSSTLVSVVCYYGHSNLFWCSDILSGRLSHLPLPISISPNNVELLKLKLMMTFKALGVANECIISMEPFPNSSLFFFIFNCAWLLLLSIRIPRQLNNIYIKTFLQYKIFTLFSISNLEDHRFFNKTSCFY